MRGSDLTKTQAQALHSELQPMLAYFAKLHDRMEVCDFEPDDKLFVLVTKANTALQDLFIERHYLGWDGVGR
jgi:hypothetical protein